MEEAAVEFIACIRFSPHVMWVAYFQWHSPKAISYLAFR